MARKTGAGDGLLTTVDLGLAGLEVERQHLEAYAQATGATPSEVMRQAIHGLKIPGKKDFMSFEKRLLQSIIPVNTGAKEAGNLAEEGVNQRTLQGVVGPLMTLESGKFEVEQTA